MRRLIPVLLLCALLLSGCAANGVQPENGYAPPESERLVVYTSHKEEIYRPIIREFEQRTGIWVQLETGGTNEMLEQIALESDYPQADLMFGGGVESLQAFSEYFDDMPSGLDDNLLACYMLAGSKWLPFSSLPVVLIYNQKLTGDDPPTGWASLLDSRWKGKIAFARPDVSGSSYTALATLLQALPGTDEALMEAFYRNLDGKLLEGSGLVVGAVSDGDSLIGVTLEETARKGIAAGEDIAVVYPEEGTSDVPDGIALVMGCAHRDNAVRFIAFVLGTDVQKRLSTDFYRRSVRADLAEPARDFRIIDYDIVWASGHKAELLAAWSLLTEEGAP